MYEHLDGPVRERLWPLYGAADRDGRAAADAVQQRTRGRWTALWGPYSQALTVFWLGPAPTGGYHLQTGVDSVWDSIAAAELELALLHPFGPPPPGSR